jgi:hypothetical protein
MRSTQESGAGEPAVEVAALGAVGPAPLYAEGPAAEVEGPAVEDAAAEAEGAAAAGPAAEAEGLAEGGLPAPLGTFLAAAAARAAAAPDIPAGVCGAVVPAASEASPDAPAVAAARAAAAPPPVGTLAGEALRGCSASPSGRNAIIRNSVISNPDR